MEFGRERTGCGEVGPHNGHFHWRRRAEIHDPAHDIARLERKLRARKPFAEPPAQGLFEILEPKPRLRFQRHLQHALMRPAGPEKNRIDWIRGGLHSDIAKGDVDVAGAGGLFDLVEDVDREPLSRLELGARRGTEPKLKLMRTGRGKDLAAKRHADADRHREGDDRVYRDKKAACGRHPMKAV